MNTMEDSQQIPSEPCICPKWGCCSLCSMWSCDCPEELHSERDALKRLCKAHPKPTFADYSRAVKIDFLR